MTTASSVLTSRGGGTTDTGTGTRHTHGTGTGTGTATGLVPVPVEPAFHSRNSYPRTTEHIPDRTYPTERTQTGPTGQAGSTNRTPRAPRVAQARILGLHFPRLGHGGIEQTLRRRTRCCVTVVVKLRGTGQSGSD